MTSAIDEHGHEHSELVSLYALEALPVQDVAAVEARIAGCAGCRRELEALRPVVERFISWPTNILRPAPSLRARLAQRIAAETGAKPVPVREARWAEPEWEEVAPGISCKLLASDTAKHIISMLVRLAPGTSYPPHAHAGVEELHLLDGELWIEDRKLYPGDYNRGEPGTSDKRVWSETGCTCVLITSTLDELR